MGALKIVSALISWIVPLAAVALIIWGCTLFFLTYYWGAVMNPGGAEVHLFGRTFGSYTLGFFAVISGSILALLSLWRVFSGIGPDD